jgi:hypothetical protein
MRRWIAIVAACLGLVACVRDGPTASPAPAPAPAPAPPRARQRPPCRHRCPPTRRWCCERARAFRVYEHPGPGAVLARTLAATNDWAQPCGSRRSRLRRRGGITWYRCAYRFARTARRGGSAVPRWRPVTWRTDRGRSLRASPVADRRRAGDDLYEVGVGAADSPTAPGHFFVWARAVGPRRPYGVLARTLGVLRRHHRLGGGGRLAIHGTSHRPIEARTSPRLCPCLQPADVVAGRCLARHPGLDPPVTRRPAMMGGDTRPGGRG